MVYSQNIRQHVPNWMISYIKREAETDNIREIAGHPLYYITDNGQVWSLVPRGNTLEPLNDQPLRMMLRNSRGTVQVGLATTPGDKATYSIAQLILLNFVGAPPFEGAEAQRIDPTKPATLDNVAWGDAYTRSARRSDRVSP